MTNRMVGSVLTLLTLLFSAGGGAAQTYTQMQWGLNKAVTPYQFGANINGVWSNLGTISAAGVWSIPSTNVAGIILLSVTGNASVDASSLVTAIATSRPIAIPAGATFQLSTAQAATVLPALRNILFLGPTTMNIAAGVVSVPSTVDLYNPSAINLTLAGPFTPSRTVSAVAYVSGAAKDYRIKYTVSTASGISVGQYVVFSALTGTGAYRAAEGAFRVTNVVGNEVTVKNTANIDTWPTMSVSGGGMSLLTTILRWPANMAGIRIGGGSLGGLRNLVIGGAFDISSNPAADSADDGLQVGTAANTSVTSLNESEQVPIGAIWAQNVAFVEWKGNGIRVFGGGFYGSSISSCSNGWRGIQAAGSGYASVKYSSAVGNGASGYQTEKLGSMDAIGSAAIGNGDQGVFAIGSGFVQANIMWSAYNRGAGIDARNGSNIVIDGAFIDSNDSAGVNATSANVTAGLNTVISNNTFGSAPAIPRDVILAEGAVFNATGASSVGILDINDVTGTMYIAPSGAKTQSLTELRNLTTNATMRQTISSIGDVFTAFNASGSGPLVNTLGLKADGTFYPVVNNTAALGRTGEVFGKLYVNKIKSDATGVSFNDVATPIAKPTVTGSRAGNAALESLLTALANYGLIVDSTTP